MLPISLQQNRDVILLHAWRTAVRGFLHPLKNRASGVAPPQRNPRTGTCARPPTAHSTPRSALGRPVEADLASERGRLIALEGP